MFERSDSAAAVITTDKNGRRVAIIGFLLAAYAAALITGCAPKATTRIDMANGTYESDKDIKAAAIEVEADGKGKRKVVIKDLDSSASSVINAQAEAMRAQAESFKSIAEALDKALDRALPTAVGAKE
jgi:orotate phosphoribosyltransferase